MNIAKCAAVLLAVCLAAGVGGGVFAMPVYAVEDAAGSSKTGGHSAVQELQDLSADDASEEKNDASEKENDESEEGNDGSDENESEELVTDSDGSIGYTQISSDDTSLVGSTYAALMSGDDGTLIAGKNAMEPMYPASMTKIMTVLVAAEHIEHLSETAIVTQRQIDYAIAHDCTTVGFKASEQPTMADLLYGTILISGADAALALAEHVAGSEEAFVALMNEKAEELGLQQTHFTNPIGLYSPNNVSTAQEMAVILAAAIRNPLVYKVLSTQQYTTTPTRQHPDGITITNMFLLRSGRLETQMNQTGDEESEMEESPDDGFEDDETSDLVSNTDVGLDGNDTAGFESESENDKSPEDAMSRTREPGLVLSAKTGFVNQSLYCAASLYIRDDGRKFICVTGKTDTAMHCVEDHAAMYRKYADPYPDARAER